MEIIKEEIKNDKKLSNNDKEMLAKDLKANFNKWDEDRQTQVDTAKEIMTEVYLNHPKRKNKEDDWKADVKLLKPYTIKKAKKAAIWREIWSNPAQMFDIKGTSNQTEKNKKIQKAAIVDSLEKISIGKQYDDATDNLYDIGEMIFVTDWEEKTKIVRRQDKHKGWIKIELPVCKNARVESISPFMFVFDHSNYKIRNKKSWDSCIKIYKRFETIDNIKTNTVYSLAKEQEEELQIKEQTDENNKTIDETVGEIKYGDKYEVLYCHGDFKINGRLYKNYVAEVLAGKYLIRFEENPIYINPFILCALEYDPITKRGISPLKAILNLSFEKEKTVNTTMDMQRLSLNPPCWVNEDLVERKNTKINISPGLLIKYKNNYSGSMPIPLSINYTALDKTVVELDQTLSEVSSTNANMSGAVDKKEKFATNLNLADKGANSQVAKELDTINQDLTIPMIENVAELLAMFKDGIETVYAKEKGKNIEFHITNEIRQAQYSYIYEDRNAILDRKAKFNELYQIFVNVAKDPELKAMIDWREVIEAAVEMIGFDNTDKFFNPETPLNMIFEQLKKLPPEIQEQFVQFLQRQLQNIVPQVQEGQGIMQAMQWGAA